MDAALRRQTLADLLRRTAKRFPGKTAIICGDTTWSYATFEALCDRLAAGLASRGVAKGARVAILSRNSHAFAALRFALARLGAVLVPINFMLKAEEAAFILRHAGAELLATDTGDHRSSLVEGSSMQAGDIRHGVLLSQSDRVSLPP